MATNYVQEGKTLDLIVPTGGVVSGGGYVIGNIFGIAASDGDEDDVRAFHVVGVFDLPAETHATTQAIAVGGPVYWDESAEQATKTAAGNIFIGLATEAKVSTVASVRVRLSADATGDFPPANPSAHIADLVIADVTGVNGTGSNAASKADVDTAFDAVEAKINAILDALEAHDITATA